MQYTIRPSKPCSEATFCKGSFRSSNCFSRPIRVVTKVWQPEGLRAHEQVSITVNTNAHAAVSYIHLVKPVWLRVLPPEPEGFSNSSSIMHIVPICTPHHVTGRPEKEKISMSETLSTWYSNLLCDVSALQTYDQATFSPAQSE